MIRLEADGVTAARQFGSDAIEATLAAQGIALAPGRGERLARALQSLLDASAADPLRESLAFDADPPGFLLAIHRCKAR
jgi:hypothetical protein